jgi:hypothetical protein
MYDHQTESLWLQVRRQAVAGPLTGAKLERLPSTITSWKKWRKRYPQTEVLSLNTGHLRNYTKDPYEDYYDSKKGLFSFLRPGPGAKEKELVVGVEISGSALAVRMEYLRAINKIKGKIDEHEISIKFDADTDGVIVHDQSGNVVNHMVTYWMVWEGVYPDTKLINK